MKEIASTYKVAFHQEKLRAYLCGEPVYPVTLEMDISNACDRDCPDCPSTSAQTAHNLSDQFIARLFGCLQGQTRGLLLTGGEPTMAPLFPSVLRMAREHDFLDVAIVSNGSRLDQGAVADALLEHASVVRVSMYDWPGESRQYFDSTLDKIQTLR